MGNQLTLSFSFSHRCYWRIRTLCLRQSYRHPNNPSCHCQFRLSLSSRSSFLVLNLTPSLFQPWGPASSPITIASLPSKEGVEPILIAFIARHSPNHSIPPSLVNSRANIAALKHLGCKSIIAFSAVGSLREEIAPGDLVVPDQCIDRTKVSFAWFSVSLFSTQL